MCGEHLAVRSPLRMDSGSSPHVRGALQLPVDFRHIAGIIPACAGSTRRALLISPPRWDHPRMCGEHYQFTRHNLITVGSSPHVRGAHRLYSRNHASHGIIPACAGSTRKRIPVVMYRRDHPRMCGEHSLQQQKKKSTYGIIPACAGSTRNGDKNWRTCGDHPRMCGEHA